MNLELQLCAIEAIAAGIILVVAFTWKHIRKSIDRQKGWRAAGAIRPNIRRA